MTGVGESADYRIVARIVAEDASDAGARSAERRLDSVERRGLGVGATLARVFGFLGGVTGVGALVRGIIGLNSHMEDARLGLAGLFSATAGIDIGQGFRVATGELATLRRMAAAGAGELDDYIGVFQQIYMPLHGAGADMERINKLLGQTVAVGFATGRGAEGARLLGFDVQQALTVGAGQRTTPMLNMVLAGIGMTSAGFNALSKEAKLTRLEEAFGKWQGAVDEFGKTWGARYSTFLDNVKGIVRTVTKPLFDKWSDQLGKVNDWLVKNEERIKALADVWGQRLLRTWDHLVERAGTYAALVAAASVAQVAPSMRGMGAGAWQGVSGAASSLVGAYRWGSTLPGRVGVGGRVAGGVAAVLGQGAASAMPALSGLARIAGPLAILATVFVAIRSAISAYPSVTASVLASWRRLMESFGKLGTAFDSLTTKGSLLSLAGAGMLQAFGWLLDLGGIVVRVLASLAAGIGLVLQVITDGLVGIYQFATGDLAGAAAIDPLKRVMDTNKLLKDIWTFDEPITGPTPEEIAAGLPEGRAGGGNTYIGEVNVAVKQEANADPARVARVFDEVLERVARNRTQAARNPILSPG